MYYMVTGDIFILFKTIQIFSRYCLHSLSQSAWHERNYVCILNINFGECDHIKIKLKLEANLLTCMQCNMTHGSSYFTGNM